MRIDLETFGHGNPDHWTPVDVALVLGCSLSDADECYAVLSDNEWREYCHDVARAKGIRSS